MDINGSDRKKLGQYGENAAAAYLRRHGFTLVARNYAQKTGEIDLIVQKDDTLHFVEVKTVRRARYAAQQSKGDSYDPGDNIHPQKIRRISRTAQWYVLENNWEGDVQIDACLVWVTSDMETARVRYLPQIA